MDDKIIKARVEPETPAGAPKVLKREVYEAGLEARQIIESAQRQSQAILDAAVRRADDAMEAGRQQGYRDGLARWAEALEALRGAREALHAKYEPEVVKLAVKIAEKVIGEELRTRPETIVSITRECLRMVRGEHRLTIRVSASEKDIVLRTLDSLERTIGPTAQIQVVGDSAIAPGGCIVESGSGVIDARLETQLKCLEEILLRIAARR